MKISFNLKFGKFTKPLAGIAGFLAEHLFLAAIVLILLSSLLGLAAFYKYYILVQRIEPELNSQPVKFQEEDYQKIIKEWQSRGERYQGALSRQYPELLK